MAQRKRVTLIVETSLAYGRSVLRGISRYVVTHQPWSMYLDLHELMAKPPAWLETWDGDGIISRSTTPELAARLRDHRIPIVDMTDFRANPGLPHIFTDNRLVGQLAATHLKERGFRNFAYCSFSDHDWSLERCDGFRAAVADGRSFHVFESKWQEQATLPWEEQQRALGEWLQRLPKPVGILAANDMRGHHVLDACRRIELAVPEEAAVIGVDNDETLCELCDPPLSSIVPNPERVGYEAAELLDRLMQGAEWPTVDIRIPPIGIVTRQSTDVLAIDDPLVAAAVRIVRERACSGLTVTEILKEIPVSRSILEHRFRKYLRRSPQEEIRLMQLKRVRQLLEETDLTLSRIAELAGFEHSEYLSVVFKRVLGQTPGDYRRQIQASKPAARRRMVDS